MGRYLACGIATRLVIDSYLNKEEILEELSKAINLEIYEIEQQKRYLLLTLKKEIVEKNIISYIQEQLGFFGDEIDKNEVNKLNELKGKKYEELVQVACQKQYLNFQLLEGNIVSNDVSYLLRRSSIFADIIVYTSGGKTYMEEYNTIFTYLRNAIMTTSENEIRTATVVSLIG